MFGVVRSLAVLSFIACMPRPTVTRTCLIGSLTLISCWIFRRTKLETKDNSHSHNQLSQACSAACVATNIMCGILRAGYILFGLFGTSMAGVCLATVFDGGVFDLSLEFLSSRKMQPSMMCKDILRTCAYLIITAVVYATFPRDCIVGVFLLIVSRCLKRFDDFISSNDIEQRAQHDRTIFGCSSALRTLLVAIACLMCLAMFMPKFISVHGAIDTSVPSLPGIRGTVEPSFEFLILLLSSFVMYASERRGGDMRSQQKFKKESPLPTTKIFLRELPTRGQRDKTMGRIFSLASMSLTCALGLFIITQSEVASFVDLSREELLFAFTRSNVPEAQETVLMVSCAGAAALLSELICNLSVCFRSDHRMTKESIPVDAYDLSSFLRFAFHDKDTRRIMYFLALNLSFAVVEVVTGLISNSLGLLSDAGHMLFDCSSLFISVFAAFVSSWPSDDLFMLGYARVEVLSGFVNAVLLVVIALTVLCEALHRCVDPDNHHHHEHLLLPVSVGGFIINMIGLIFFHEHAHGHGGHGHHDCPMHSHAEHDNQHTTVKHRAEGTHEHRNHRHQCDHHHHHHHHNRPHYDLAGKKYDQGDDHHDDHHHQHHHHHHHHHHGHREEHSERHENVDHSSCRHHHHHHHHHRESSCSNRDARSSNMQGVFLHILADTLGSVGVIISSFLISRYGWWFADPICAIVISALILASSWPLLRETSATLLLSIERRHLKGLERSKAQILTLEGVKSVDSAQFWPLDGRDILMGSIHITTTRALQDEQSRLERDIREAYISVGRRSGYTVRSLTIQNHAET